MTVKLLWKEYRTQWGIWLALADVGLLLVVVLAEVLGQGPGFSVFRDTRIQMVLIRAASFAAICFGLMSGALVLAGDKEDGTQTFLDSLTGRRGKLWGAKFLSALCLTLLISILMGTVSKALGFASWKEAVAISALGLDAMAWGLLGGAIASTVLTGALIGIVGMVVSWLIVTFFPFLGSEPGWPKALFAIVAIYGSWAFYCQDDLWRKLARGDAKGKMLADVVTDWQALMWLARRQGRVLLLVGAVAAVVVGMAAPHEPVIAWPLGTMAIGLMCGLAAFAPDQKEGCRFLGSQRFPPGRVWLTKVVFWALAAIVLTAVAWYAEALVSWLTNRALRLADAVGIVGEGDKVFGFLKIPGAWREQAALMSAAITEAGDWHIRLTEWLGAQWYYPDVIDAPQLLGLWPLYGFCFGLFFGQLARRPAVAMVLATIITALVTGLLAPSLFFGGVAYWWLLVIPVMLLTVTRLTMRSWLSDRLVTRTPVIGIAAAGALMSLFLVCFFLNRAYGVPDVGEPTDMVALGLKIDELKKRPSGRLTRVSSGMARQSALARESEFKPPTTSIYPTVAGGTPTLRGLGGFGAAVEELVHKGWPANDKEFGPWVDQVFEWEWDAGWIGRSRGKREWLIKAEIAASLPVGLVQDPRFSNPAAAQPQFTRDGNFMARLLVARGLQLQARGDALGGLRYIDMAFAIARQMTHYSPTVVYWEAVHLEESALDGLLLWLKKTGPDKKLVEAGEKVLLNHLKNRPDPMLALQAEYMVHRTNEPQLFHGNTLVDKVFNTAAHVPWEKERQARALRAIFTGLTQELSKDPGKSLDWVAVRMKEPNDRLAQMALAVGLPPKEGPGSQLTASEWGPIIRSSRGFAYIKKIKDRLDAAEVLEELHATKVLIAACKYRIDEGKAPASWDDLVPKYLPQQVINPVTGDYFEYMRVDEKGRDFPELVPPRHFDPFQLVVHARGQDFKLAVPIWAK